MPRDARQPDPRPDGWEKRLPPNMGVVDQRQTTMRGSNGTLDIQTPMFMHKRYRVMDSEIALAEIVKLADDPEHAGDFDLSVPGAPVALRPCRICKEVQRFDLYTHERVVVSPWILGLIGIVTCETCQAKEDERLEAIRVANDSAARLAASGIEAALAKDAEKGWADIIVRARTADDGQRRVWARDALREWAANPDPGARGVWLHGPAGSGKTKAVATAALEKLKVLPVKWVSVAVLIMQLDGAWNDDERQAALKFLTDPGVVVLDDADKVTPSVRVQLALFTALEARDKAGSGILVTTNEPPSELARTFSSPMMSRLVKLAAPMAYPGPDMRLEMVS